MQSSTVGTTDAINSGICSAVNRTGFAVGRAIPGETGGRVSSRPRIKSDNPIAPVTFHKVVLATYPREKGGN